MKFYVDEKIVNIMKLAEKPLTIPELVSVIRPEDPEHGYDNVMVALTRLKKDGKVVLGSPRFCKGSKWRNTYMLAEVKQ